MRGHVSMSESEQSAEGTGPEATGSGGDPVATTLALAGASRAKADAFLDNQKSLIDIQKHHLNEQFKHQLNQLRLATWEKRLGVLLRVSTVITGLAIAAGAAFMISDAAHSQGLIIEAFSVPPDLGARGLTGEVVATRILDNLKAMQAATDSERPADSYQYNWGSEIRVEIPETGLNFSELGKWLRDRFGNVSHVTGEVVRTPTGISVTARIGDSKPETFTGAESDFDDLARKAAEAVYRTSQPYRFVQFVAGQGRADEAFSQISDLAANGPPSERGWAYNEWGMLDQTINGDLNTARRHCREALAYSGASTVSAEICLVNEEVWAGHDEIVLQYSKALAVNAQKHAPGVTEKYFESNKVISAAWLESIDGDFHQSALDWTRAESVPDYQGSLKLAPQLAATEYAINHDPRTAQKIIEAQEPAKDLSFLQLDAISAFSALPTYWIAVERQDWSTALAYAQASDAWLAAHTADNKLLGHLRTVWIQPLEAFALAKSGDIRGAETLISVAPPDCYLCLTIRARIAAMKGDGPGADYWFDRAVKAAPSVPFAYAQWGQALKARGDLTGAIAKFKLANQKGPHFSDPLEMWGEVLIAQNRSDLAIANFTEAAKYAPNWGLLHLKWGEALSYIGKTKDAQAQFVRAGGLDLTAAGKAELARVSVRN